MYGIYMVLSIWETYKQIYAKRYPEMWCHIPYEKKIPSFFTMSIKTKFSFKTPWPLPFF